MKAIFIIFLLGISVSVNAQRPDSLDKSKNAFTKAYFVGGDPAWSHFVNYYLRYPEEAALNNVRGKVVVELVVESNGKLSDMRVVSSPAEILSKEFLRVLRLSPKWKPATENGKAVKSKFTVVTMFRLDDSRKGPSLRSHFDN